MSQAITPCKTDGGSEGLSLDKSERTSTAATFQSIPQELRDLIYDVLWQEDGHLVLTPTTFQGPATVYSIVQVLIDYGGSTKYPYKTTLLTWLLTNKTFHEQGLKQLLTMSTLSWQDTIYNGCSGAVRTLCPWLSSSKVFHINLAHRAVDRHPRSEGKMVLRGNFTKQLQQVAMTLCPTIKTLHITSSAWFGSGMNLGPDSPWNVHLPHVTVQLQNLKVLHARLEMMEYH